MQLDPTIVRRQVENLKLANPDVFEDDELWALTLESETDFNELLTKIVRRIEDTKALANGTGERLQELAARKLRFEHRMDTLRSLAFKLMEAAEISKLEMPEATLSLRSVPPTVVITDDDALPDDFCKFERKPDKTKIKAALENPNCSITGAVMSNGGKTISIRIK